MKSTKVWIAIFAAILAVCAAFVFLQSRARPPAVTAGVYLDGELIRTIDLSDVREPYAFEVADGRGGLNTITVGRGRICVTEANCPDGICVKRGWSDGGGSPIVCLPHRLVISVAGGGADFDAAA
ncbi:MAG: NusG domain II-containing protein [Oscillospiraceae bacterium]|jgi:hypothetical protein|nr:NusG domain II-containing protein [Oscillospiraceae bacterium]